MPVKQPLDEFAPVDQPPTDRAHDGALDLEPARAVVRAQRPSAAQLGLSPVVDADPDADLLGYELIDPLDGGAVPPAR